MQMHIDPDVLLDKPHGSVERWLSYGRALTMVQNYRKGG
jgi:hypothetical protein